MTEKEEDLLRKARDNYPEGTVHTGYALGGKFLVKGELYYLARNIYSKNADGCIYHGHSGKWATIISKPQRSPSYWW